ncbi:unnamed protein product [Gadus morhua 'NCC']
MWSMSEHRASPPGLSWGTGVSGPTGTLFPSKKLLHIRPHRIIAILPPWSRTKGVGLTLDQLTSDSFCEPNG